MANDIEEQLSALADGEVADHELDGLLRRMRGDESLRERWSRYHLIGESLRKNLPDDVRHGLDSRVWKALQKEEILFAPPPRRRVAPYFGQFARLALTAGITAVAILGFQTLNRDDTSLSAVAGLQPPAETNTVPEPGATLDPYLVNHNEHSVSTGMQGMLPYVHLVGAVKEE